MWLSPDELRALAVGPATLRGAAVPEAWRAQQLPLIEIRLAQLARAPDHAPWLMRAMIERDSAAFAGQIGFHGAPGSNGLGAPDAVELGYSVDEPFRGRGYATEAARAMIWWARSRGNRRVFASVAPDNHASLAVVRKLGMREVTVVVDEVDGLEIVFELRGS